MKQCKATTKSGDRCKKTATNNSDYCSIHQSTDSTDMIAPAIGGALIGNLLIPGIGGVILGGILGALAASKSKNGGEDD
jgi:uncharacterized membrane protein